MTASDLAPIDPPASTLVIELTQRCNHDCRYCYNVWKNDPHYPSGELGTADTLASICRALDESGVRHVTLSGGEPLLRHDLMAIIEALRARSVGINLVTNGTLLDEATVGRLSPDKVSVFELPLLSSVAAVHDELSGVVGAHEKATLAIANLKLAGQTVVAVFVATQRNVATLAETLEMAFALGVDGVMLNRFNPGGRGWSQAEALTLDPEVLRQALDLANDFTATHGLPVSCSIAMPACLFDHQRWPELSFGPCAVGTPECYPTIDPLGNVRPCNHSRLILGNLRADSFNALLHGRALQQFAAAHPAFCDDCPLVATCQGGCKAAAEVCFGDARRCDPFLLAYRDQAHKPRGPAQG